MCLSTRSSNQARRSPSESRHIQSLISIPRPSRQGETVPRYERKGFALYYNTWLAFTCSLVDWCGNDRQPRFFFCWSEIIEHKNREVIINTKAWQWWLQRSLNSLISNFQKQGYTSHHSGDNNGQAAMNVTFKRKKVLYKTYLNMLSSVLYEKGGGGYWGSVMHKILVFLLEPVRKTYSGHRIV